MRIARTPWHGVARPPCHIMPCKTRPHVLLHVSSSSDHQYIENPEEEDDDAQKESSSSGNNNNNKKKNASIVRTAETRGSFAIRLQRRRGPGRCAYCDSSGRIACRECGGSGVVDDTNESSSLYHSARMNPVDVNRIVNSKWTAMERTCGWRHFHVTQTMNLFVTLDDEADDTTIHTQKGKKKKKKKTVYVLLVATCDDQVKLWCPLNMLKCRDLWAAGWLQKSELQSLIHSRQHTATKPCERCDGGGTVPCMFCSGNAIIDLSTASPFSFPW